MGRRLAAVVAVGGGELGLDGGDGGMHELAALNLDGAGLEGGEVEGERGGEDGCGGGGGEEGDDDGVELHVLVWGDWSMDERVDGRVDGWDWLWSEPLEAMNGRRRR